jgi:hypothetical protein
MDSGRFFYVRTPAGKAALQGQDPSVPVEYRRLLGLLERETHPQALRRRLGRFSEADTRALLDELVDRGLLEMVDASAGNRLDFSGDFAELLPSQR